MLQPLKRKSKKLMLLRLRLRNFLKHELYVYFLVFASIIICAWIFDRYIEGIMLCIAHTCVRNSFDKQFHFNKTAYCVLLTLAIVWFAVPFTLPVSISLLSAIPISFLISFVGFVVQDRIDAVKRANMLAVRNNYLASKLQSKPIEIMDKREFYEFCKVRGLTETECLLAYYIFIEGLKGKDLYGASGYSEAQVKRKRKKIVNMLK